MFKNSKELHVTLHYTLSGLFQVSRFSFGLPATLKYSCDMSHLWQKLQNIHFQFHTQYSHSVFLLSLLHFFYHPLPLFSCYVYCPPAFFILCLSWEPQHVKLPRSAQLNVELSSMKNSPCYDLLQLKIVWCMVWVHLEE